MGRLNGKDKGKEKRGWKGAEERVVFPFLVCKEKRGEQIYIGKNGGVCNALRSQINTGSR